MNCHLYHYAMSIFVSSYLFLVWSLFCLIWAWLHLLFWGRGCHLLGVSSSIFHFELICLSVELRWISWKQYIVGSCAWIHLATVFWLVNTVHWHLGWLLINEELLLPFYLLLSSFSTSPLSLFPYASACHSSLVVFCYASLISSFFMFSVSALDLCFVVTMKFVENVSDKSPFSAGSILSSLIYSGPILFLFPFYGFVVSNCSFSCCKFVTKLK